MESVYLQGSEEVQAAARSMHQAAQEMNQAASQIDYALRQHQQWMEDWLLRFQAAMQPSGHDGTP
jgi:RecA/RadA recombinase